ncbi:MAG: serine--tRNA ligase [Candidatus Parcubacteria bacterium]|nr:serine--tRNA ligase [Patescibacteria group bacterium]BCX16159.1 MAG: serine--tRNA ligase [Candidatus Parcubacteria bacterium]
MLDIELIRQNSQKIKDMMIARNLSVEIVDKFLSLDERWRTLVNQLDQARALQKRLSEEKKIEEAKKNKELIKEKEEELSKLEEERFNLLLEIPNIPFDDVPRGKDESENVVLRVVGEIPQFSFTPKDHLDLGEALDIIDTKTASEVAGSRFGYLKKEAALLEIALVNYAFEILTKEGFEPVIPPVFIKPEVYKKMGRLSESQKEERYYLEKDDLYLVGSAEHTLGPLGMNKVFLEEELPKRYVGFSTCFRREAGSYGKDVKGILRVHQFDKVEMYSFAHPEKSEEEHLFLLSMQEKIFQGLKIPYRVVAICTGDMGPTDARQFDIEAWMPSQNKYREIASCSNTTDYQTRGIGAKVKTKDSTKLVHALNATAIAIGRTIIAILENFQQEDGKVLVPEALWKYTGFRVIG